MKVALIFVAVAVAVVCGQYYYCPPSQADFVCDFNYNLTDAACMRDSASGAFSYICTYCEVKEASCFGNQEQVAAAECAKRSVANPCP